MKAAFTVLFLTCFVCSNGLGVVLAFGCYKTINYLFSSQSYQNVKSVSQYV